MIIQRGQITNDAQRASYCDVIDVSDRRRQCDLLALLRRGLNVWEGAPQWLVELHDELSKNCP